jgi:lipopolysaccharide biosynthesis regulator YciM
MGDAVGLGLVERARDAAAREDWQQAYDLVTEADQEGRLAAIDLALLGEVAYAAGHLDVAIEAWERAHAGTCRAVTRSGPQVRAFGSRCTCSLTLP